MNIALGLMIGVCAFAALNHLFVGARGERVRAHRAMGAFSAISGFYIFCSVWLFSATDVATLELWNRIQGAAGALLVAAGFRFAHEMLGGWNRALLLVMIGGMLVLATISLSLPAGIFYGEIVGLRFIDSGVLGRVTLSVATPNPIQPVFNALTYTPLIFVMARAAKLYTSGQRMTALLTAVAITIPVVPALIDTYMLGVETYAAPVTEAGLALSLVFLSVVISEDVARAAALREQLLRSEARHRWLVETSPDAIGLLDTRTQRFVLVNRRAEELLARPAAELVSADPVDLLYRYTEDPADHVNVARELFARALAGEPTVTEWPIAQPDGSVIPCELRLVSLCSGSDGLVRVSLLDVQERKQRDAERAELAARMRRSERLQTIGTLTDGIAHDFNNILTPLIAFGELATRQLAGHEAQSCIEAMQASALRARDLVRQIMVTQRTGEPCDGVIALESVVRQALRFVRAAAPSRIELDSTMDAPDAHIRGTATGVHQIVMNLALNAVHAMGETGTLRVTLRLDGDVAELRIADTGHGIDAYTLEHIFDPFFTTKEVGRGTGLGLSIVRDIVNGWDAAIAVHSVPGQGTTFVIRFPTVEAAVEVPAVETGPPRGGREAVLLVDDDAAALAALEHLLAHLGYRVAGFSDAHAALRAAREQAFDACVTDYDMRAMNGVALVEQLRVTRPCMPVVLVSGSAEGLRQAPPPDGPFHTLAKPIGLVALDHALRAVLDEPPARRT